MMRRALVVRACFPLSDRQTIEWLARQAPESVGRDETHWSRRSLAQAAEAYVGCIAHTTVDDILQEADLHPEQLRYWKTVIWDDEAVARATKTLWYYERIESLWQRGEVIICVDEKPNLQVLERAKPAQLMRPGQPERQEFEYIRHGTVNLLAGLITYNGRMWAECLDRNDGAHFRPAMRRLLHPYGWAKHIHVILDSGPSHTSGDTLAFFDDLAPRVQVLWTPVDGSWLNQAESLLEAFSERYLLRGDWSSRELMIQHILASRLAYNQHYAHPFAWHWSVRDFQYWLNNTPGLIRCKT
jgi:DDE superfamily endonuclease